MIARLKVVALHYNISINKNEHDDSRVKMGKFHLISPMLYN